MRGQQASQVASRAAQLIDSVRGRRLSDAELAAAASELAGLLLEEAERQKLPIERQRAELLARLMQDDAGQAFTTLLTDRVVRSHDPERVVDAARQLLRVLGVPKYLPASARLQLRALLHAGPFLPGLAADGILARIRREADHVVLPAEDPALADYLTRRKHDGVRVNVNQLGESVLGEHEAEARVAEYVALLARPDVESISIKISSIFSQIDLLAWDATLEALSSRLRAIYRAALAQRFVRRDGRAVAKLVNLDMESYRDLELTLLAFRCVLDEPELAALSAGIVLQAYLPDSAPHQRELTAWAQARVARGAAPIRLRVVKGANLLTERVDAAVRGFALPTFATKAEVDSSFKAMIEFGCRPEHAAAVRLGIASHNLFDIALGMLLRAQNDVGDYVGFELLEGMADHVQRTVHALTGDTLVYAPLCAESAMQTAIAYLMRRLDENTAKENFLRHSFGMCAGDASFDAEAERFSRAFAARQKLDHTSRRKQDRRASPVAREHAGFDNEPDTDFSLAHNRAWITEIVARLRERPCFEIALQVGGELRASAPSRPGFDPSRPGFVPYRYAVATEPELDRAIECAVRAAAAWRDTPIDARAAALRRVADGLRATRGELIAAMVLDAGKRIEQADAEVSEAIDFAEYYAESFCSLVRAHPDLEFAAKGVALITPPWNFPLAIPAGGVLAGLMAGNAVLLKPALETVFVAERLARVCWDAGIALDCLQFVICEDDLGSRLVRDPRVDQIVLTGATDTAKLFLRLRPHAPLAAETGGKNAILVSAMADRDEAIKDALASAFGHAGQKCSACSLLICEAEVYDDPAFLRTLKDAAESLPVGPSWDPRSVVTPLIRPPEGALARALTTLEPGESWLLEPRIDRENPRLVSPGIKLGVREASFTHTTELFGPVLGVMRADDLEHAQRLANATRYGLTAGLFSLDEHEQARFAEAIEAGNLYINRPITGAIVRRQPFGGCKASSVGPGAKAGGPNYVAQLTRVCQRAAPRPSQAPEALAAGLIVALRSALREEERERLGIGACSYAHALRSHFAVDHEPGSVLGERNVFRYVRCEPLLLRAAEDADRVDLLLSIVAALSVGARFELSLDPGVARGAPKLDALVEQPLRIENAEDAAAQVVEGCARVRALGTLEPEIANAADAALVHVANEPVLLSGRIELLHYFREQALSQRYHRYGNLAPERLLPPLRTPS